VVWRAALVVVAALGVSGCVSSGITTVADGVGAVGTFVVGAPDGLPRPVQIFVASNRKGDKGAAAQASADNALRYSLTTVSVPPVHQPGSIERPSLGSQNVSYHFVVTGRRALDEDTFANEVASHLSGRIGSNRDILLFVHGFDTSLDDARWRLAQIVADGRFGGVPVLYTWASQGSVFAYGSDRETAMASRDGLEKLMLELAHEPDVGRVHILAHSMGAWLAMEALRENAIAGHADLDGHLGEVMLAAPDIDAAVFRQQMARLGSGAHVSILVARNDRALGLSSLLANERPRLGALNPADPNDRAMIEQLGVNVTDLSGAPGGFIGHSTYANAPGVIAAIGAQIGAARDGDKTVQAVLDARGDPPVVATPLPPAGAVVATPAAAVQASAPLMPPPAAPVASAGPGEAVKATPLPPATAVPTP
jgi:esterase/lipase superfamily enzyme